MQAAKPQAVIVNTTPVIEGYKNTLDGSKSKDKDGDVLTYSWKQIKGLPVTIDNPSAAVTTFTNPLIIKNDKPTKKHQLIFELTVDDGKQGIDRKTVKAVVWPVNAYPVANAGLNQFVTAEEAASGVVLDGSGSSDDGVIVRYQWKLLSKLPKKARFRMINAKSPKANFTYSYPDQSAPLNLAFELTVMDNDKVKRSANTSVTILHQGGVLLPVANAGVDQTVTSDSVVTLDSAQSKGSIESYNWIQTAGPEVQLSGAETALVNFTAPKVKVPVQLTFELTVGNATGSAKDNVIVTVKPAIPDANAGSDQTVISGAAVSLNGEQSTGFIDSFRWSQIAGPDVNLSTSNHVSAGFTAPDVITTTVMSFKLITANSSGPSEDTVDVTVKPKIPNANAGEDQTVFSASTVNLNGSQSSGAIDSYVWTQISGPTVILNNANSVSAGFTSPHVNKATDLKFKLTIANVTGASDDIVSVAVKPSLPVANAGSDQTVESGASVNLNGTQSSGVIDSYIWTQTSGATVALTGANTNSASFTAPNVSTSTVLNFKLMTVNSSGTSEDSVSVTVNPSKPVANAGGDQNVVSDTVVNLNGSQSIGSIDSYSWSQVGGPLVTLSNANSVATRFTAPIVTSEQVLSFKLVVTNSTGSSEDIVYIIVNTTGVAPVANAGVDQTVVSGVTVSLNGSFSEGTNNQYRWTEIPNATVTISGAETALASFTAPTVTVPTTLNFKLAVSNTLGSSDDSVSITINPSLPTANAGPDQTVVALHNVSLTSQSLGVIDSYLWSQTAGTTVSLAGGNSANASFTAPNVTVQTTLTFKLITTNISGSTEDSVKVTVNPNITGNLTLQVGNAGNVLNLSLDNLLGGLAPYKVTINWGDGHISPETTYITPTDTHTYTATGSFTVTVTVIDDNGLSKVFTNNISVAEVGCGLPG